MNESLTIKNNEVAFPGRKLKRSGHLHKNKRRNGAYFKSRNTQRKRVKNVSYK